MSKRLQLISQHLISERLIIHQILENSIGFIKLNRPKVLNSLNDEIFTEINNALERFQHDDNVKVVIITGSEKAFAAGADVNGFLPATPESAIKYLFLEVFTQKLNHFPKPVIAAINGYALGGGLEMAMTCDILIANKNAKIGQPEINLGIIPGVGGSQRFSRSSGKNAAMEYLLTGKMLTAQEGYELNIISEVTEEDALVKALEIAKKISCYPLPTLMWLKRSILATMENGTVGGLQQELAAFAATLSLPTKAEAIKNFMKRSLKVTN